MIDGSVGIPVGPPTGTVNISPSPYISTISEFKVNNTRTLTNDDVDGYSYQLQLVQRRTILNRNVVI